MERSPPSSAEILRQFRWVGVGTLFGGSLIVSGAVYSVLSGGKLDGPLLVWLLLGLAAVFTSIHLLTPSRSRKLLDQLAATVARPREEVAKENLKRAQKALLASLVILVAEIYLVLAFWPPPEEWRPWVAAFVGVTILFSAMFTAILFRSRAESLDVGR